MPDRSPADCLNGERPTPPYFVGVYQTTQPLPDPFATPGWISHCEDYAKAIGLGAAASARFSFKGAVKQLMYGDAHIGRHLPAAWKLLRKALAERGKIKVLDLGGGFGDNFHLLSRLAPVGRSPLTMADIDYHVVDNQRSCDLGRRLFANASHGPQFFTDIPDTAYDVVLLIGTLQYIHEFRGLFAKLQSCCSGYLYVARSPIRMSGETFLTRQIVCPAYGDEALKKIGETFVTVVSRQELFEVMGAWKTVLDEHQTDYSENFARLPQDFRNVAYWGMGWSRPELP
jgi:putative methyltransferase (TIGR04325 family)